MTLPIRDSRLAGAHPGVDRDGLICEGGDGVVRFRHPTEHREEGVTFRAEDGSVRSIGIAGGRLVEVAAPGDWSGLGAAVRMLRSGRSVEPWRLALFAQCGQLFIEPLPAAEWSDEIVCACKGVTRGEIAGHVAALVAAHPQHRPDRAAIGRACGAGTVCGGCGPAIDEIAGQGSMADAELVAVESYDGEVKRFRFRHFAALPVAAAPGAFVNVQAVIGSRRIARPYTVVGTTADGGIEILVKRDAAGVFSRWLHDHATVGQLFRLSLPQGSRGGEARRPLFFIAAGIGITPALAEMSGTASRQDAPLAGVHWSVRSSASAFVAAVTAQAQAAGCPLTVHDTARQGRVTDWAAVCPPGSAGGVVVCGPPAFQHAVVVALRRGGWAAGRVTVESFGSRQRVEALPHVDSFDYLQLPVVSPSFHLAPVDSVQAEAHSFLRQFYYEHGAPDAFALRWREVAAAITGTGTYRQTYEELAFGARLAWRNAARCIGRFFWRSLQVRDLRYLASEEAIFAAIVEHLAQATNGGDIQAMISIFAPGEPRIRILNPQLILYAGHKQADGSVVGDPRNVELTALARDLGWRGAGSAFDVLPIIIQIGDREPRCFPLPPEVVLEVELAHPRHPDIAALGLRWFAVPAVAGMALDVGGLQYTAAPSNGFYMGTEIGSLNLSDPARYDQLSAIAAATGLDTRDSLWRDQAMLDLNVAVLHSFKKAGVRILDHHSLSDFFMRFREEEALARRPSYGHWAWVMPPMGGNLSPVWRDNTLKKKILKPNYFYQSLAVAQPARRAVPAALGIAAE